MASLLIVGIGGAARSGSSSEKALDVSLAAARSAGADIVKLAGPDLDLPMYSPIDHERNAPAARLIDLLRQSDGIVISSPAYHGTISGLVKNALDYTEDMREDGRPYFDGRAVGCIACGFGWQGAASTLATLRSITHALRGWPTPLGVAINTKQAGFDGAGRCLDGAVMSQLETLGRQVVDFARAMAAADPMRRNAVAEAAE